MKKKISMIALDLDGTLLDDQGRIPRQNKKILQGAHNQGIIIVLSSGRMTDCITPFSRRLNLDTALIAYNGAMVKATEKEKRKEIFHRPLPVKYSDMLIDFSEENDYLLNYYLGDKLYARQEGHLRKYSNIYATQTGAKYHFVPSLKRFKGNSSTKLIIITRPTQTGRPDPRSRDELYKHFSSILGEKVTLTKTNPEYLEFMHKKANKGIALKIIARHYGIKISEVIAFGDGDNDAPMIAAAGIGVAMVNGGKLAKKAARIATSVDNNKAGVARTLETFL